MNRQRILHLLVSAGSILALVLGAPVNPSAAEPGPVIAVFIEQNNVRLSLASEHDSHPDH
jgi:hypothetical protein